MLKFDDLRRVTGATVVALAAMLLSVGGAEALKPSRVLADELPALDLETVIPKRFGDWVVRADAAPVVSDPTLDATLAKFYSQTLARTYVNSRGQAIMLSLAYGKNQNSWNTAAHRPEFCYDAQGFTVAARGVHDLPLAGHEVPSVRMVGTKHQRQEPVTYWVTLADTVTVPGFRRKLQQVRYGLQGQIVDGLLVRMSSLGHDEAEEFALHEAFAREWERAMSPDMRPRFFGH